MKGLKNSIFSDTPQLTFNLISKYEYITFEAFFFLTYGNEKNMENKLEQ